VGRGPLYGTVTVTPGANDPASVTTAAAYVYPESGTTVTRRGEALVYTGYQWRGRTNPDTDTELREVLFVERDQREMSGRWFTGGYDEIGPDVTLRRAGADALVSGVFPRALQRGGTVTVTLYGAGLPGATATDAVDLGRGVTVRSVERRADGTMALSLQISADAPVGPRDLFAFGATLPEAVVVHDGVDRITVTPETGMARVGGAVFPKGFQTFDAIGWDDGPDGEPETDDDLRLGRVVASWSVDEYAAVYGDEDLRFVGEMRPEGVFEPALDGPNPEREGNRNNVGDVWVVATHSVAGGGTLTARSHLVVTVPLYMRFEPWREIDPRRVVGEGGR
jgi:quinohemoprotein amine dehydrogenase